MVELRQGRTKQIATINFNASLTYSLGTYRTFVMDIKYVAAHSSSLVTLLADRLRALRTNNARIAMECGSTFINYCCLYINQ